MALRYSPETAVNIDVRKLTGKSLEGEIFPHKKNSVTVSSLLSHDEKKNVGICFDQPNLFHLYFSELVDKVVLDDNDAYSHAPSPHRGMDVSSRFSEPLDSEVKSRSGISSRGSGVGHSGSHSVHCFSSSSPRTHSRPEVSRKQKTFASTVYHEDPTTDLQRLRRSLDVPATSLQWIKKKQSSSSNVWQRLLKFREEKKLRNAGSAMVQTESSEKERDFQTEDKMKEVQEAKTGESKDQESESLKLQPSCASSCTASIPESENGDPCCQGDVPREPVNTKEKKMRKEHLFSPSRKWNKSQNSRQLTEVVYPPYSLNPEVTAVSAQVMNSLKVIDSEVKGGAGDLMKLPCQRSKFLQHHLVLDSRNGEPQIGQRRSQSQARLKKSRSTSVARSRPATLQLRAKQSEANATKTKATNLPEHRYNSPRRTAVAGILCKNAFS